MLVALFRYTQIHHIILLIYVLDFYKTNITVEIITNEENQDCAANTNTSEHCSFSWRGTYRDSSESSDHLEVLGSTIDLKSRDVELSSMRCRAECIIRNKSCVSETMFIGFLSGEGSFLHILTSNSQFLAFQHSIIFLTRNALYYGILPTAFRSISQPKGFFVI